MAGTVQDRPPDARTEIVNLISDGARVASEHIGRGTHTGPFVRPAGTIPPAQRAFELRIGEFCEMHEGKIAKLRAYYDSATMMRQLGLLPPAGSGVEKAMTALMAAGVKAKRAVMRR
jgi:predicted ester cyclase